MDSSPGGNCGTDCGDAEALRRLVDGELTGTAEELWLHHAVNCPACGARVAELRAMRAWCAERLGNGDAEAETLRDGAVSRVKARLDARLGARERRPAWRWWSSSLAAGLAALAFVLMPGPKPLGASAERVERETVLRERAWLDQPGKVVRWTIDSEIANNPRVADGRYRTVWWKHNLAGGRTAQLLKKFDAAGALVWARRNAEDGSEVAYNPVAGTVSMWPSTRELREEGRSLELPLRDALESWIARNATIHTETRAYVETFSKSALRSAAPTIDLLNLPDLGDVYRVRRRYRSPASSDRLITVDSYIAREGFRRVRQESTHVLADGRVQREVARWSDYRTVPASEFAAEVRAFTSLAAAVPTGVRHTARQIAVQEQARLANRAANATQKGSSNAK